MSSGFYQKASARLNLQVVPGSNHCAVGEEGVHLDVTVKINFREKFGLLDNQGFLLNSLAFGQEFKRLEQQAIGISCEKLCEYIKTRFLQLCGDKRNYVESVEITLSPFVGMELGHYEDFRPKQHHIGGTL